MPIVFTMNSRMIVIVSVCTLLLFTIVFVAGMHVGSRLDVRATSTGPAVTSPVASVSASSAAAWPTATASDTSSINRSGE